MLPCVEQMKKKMKILRQVQISSLKGKIECFGPNSHCFANNARHDTNCSIINEKCPDLDQEKCAIFVQDGTREIITTTDIAHFKCHKNFLR